MGMKNKPVSHEKPIEEEQPFVSEEAPCLLQDQPTELVQSFDLLIVKLNTIEEASESDVLQNGNQNAEKVEEKQTLPNSKSSRSCTSHSLMDRASSPIEMKEVEGAGVREIPVTSEPEENVKGVEEGEKLVDQLKEEKKVKGDATCNKCGQLSRLGESIAKLLENQDRVDINPVKTDSNKSVQTNKKIESDKRSLGINCKISIESEEEAAKDAENASKGECSRKSQAINCNLSIKSPEDSLITFRKIKNICDERNRSDEASNKSQAISCNLSVPSIGELAEVVARGDGPLKVSQGITCKLSLKSDEEMSDVVEDEKKKKLEKQLVEKSIKNNISVKGPKDKNLAIQTMPPINIRQGLVMQQTLHLDIKPTGSIINVMTQNSNIGYREIRKSSNNNVSSTTTVLPSYKGSGNVDAAFLYTNSKAFLPVSLSQCDQPSTVTDTNFANRLAKTLEAVSIEHPDFSDDRMLFFKSYQVVEQQPKHSVDGVKEVSVSNVSRVNSEVYRTYINPAGYATIPGDKLTIVPLYGNVATKSGAPIYPISKSSEEIPIKPATATKVEVAAVYPRTKPSEETAIAVTVPTSDGTNSSDNENSTFSTYSNKSRSPWDIGFYSSKTTQCDLRKQSSDSSSAVPYYQRIEVRRRPGQFAEIPERDVPDQEFSSRSATSSSSDSVKTYTKQPEEPPVTSVDKATSPKMAAPKTNKDGLRNPPEKTSPVNKVDQDIQVSLSSSSNEESAVGVRDETHPSTIDYFIEGLTQATVQDISSFQKSSQIALHREELKKIRSSFDKNKKSHNAGEPVTGQELSSDHGNRVNSTVFRMGVTSLSRGSGENSRSPQSLPINPAEGVFTHQTNPTRTNTFFSENNLELAASDSTTVDESISEGELKCKCSVSIGELHVCKQGKPAKQGVKYLKMHPGRLVRRELKDRSLSVSRQKAFYDNWVAYYTEKKPNRPVNDSSTTSTNSFTKR